MCESNFDDTMNTGNSNNRNTKNATLMIEENTWINKVDNTDESKGWMINGTMTTAWMNMIGQMNTKLLGPGLMVGVQTSIYGVFWAGSVFYRIVSNYSTC